MGHVQGLHVGDPAQTGDLGVDLLERLAGGELADPGLFVLRIGHVVVGMVASDDHQRTEDDLRVTSGLDGLDEISLLGKTRIMELRDGEFRTYEIAPEDFGLERCTLEEIRTGTPEENAATIRGVFDGSIRDARRNAVLINAAGALIVGDKASDFKDGIAKVAEIIDSGKAMAKLNELVERSNQYCS